MRLSGKKIPQDQAARLGQQYRTSLLDDVVPWWMNHSLDREFGGYFSLLARDGRLWGTDKYMWMNGRQIWMLSHLFNTLEPKSEWLDAAKLGVEFMCKHAFKGDGKMHFRLTRAGQSRSDVLSVYTEVFGAMAMAEYAKASGDESYWDKAMAMYDFLIPRLGQPSDTPLLGYPLDAEFHPGHAIESAWMLMEIARKRGDEGLLQTAIDITLASLEHGWDSEFGGLRYITNFDWTPTHSLEADLKLWWPHGEALYTLLLAWDLTGREDLARWYQKVHGYTFTHFPDPEYGECFGYLNRDGSRVWSAKANGWKGLFHLPRTLCRCYDLLR